MRVIGLHGELSSRARTVQADYSAHVTFARSRLPPSAIFHGAKRGDSASAGWLDDRSVAGATIARIWPCRLVCAETAAIRGNGGTIKSMSTPISTPAVFMTKSRSEKERLVGNVIEELGA
jgi:hypothetical protein